MRITVNGEAMEVPEGETVRELVLRLRLEERPIAVECNRAIVPKPSYARTTLREGDTLEIVGFVGGG